jgi:site-specific DNA-methyltransferase (adenine-specific)/modification methylase
MNLINGNCLEEMKKMEAKSVDMIFCDLPYGQTSCKWDCCIDLQEFWKQVMRVKKTNTPIIMTTTTKFGVSLINSAPKKCPFRYDLVWCKTSPCGFLSAKKMPMRKHEMIYVFYEKLPFYDLSSHKHKFIKEKENKRNGKDGVDNKGMIKNRSKTEIQNKYDPPLPTSLIQGQTLGDKGNECYGKFSYYNNGVMGYEPPLPTSLLKEGEHNEKYTYEQDKDKDLYGTDIRKEMRTGKDVGKSPIYEPPLPNSLLEIKSTRGKHSTEKPVQLIEWILKYYSKEGDLILDPTMGSGSCGVACKNMNRKFIGFELDEEIFKVAQDRCGIKI